MLTVTANCVVFSLLVMLKYISFHFVVFSSLVSYQEVVKKKKTIDKKQPKDERSLLTLSGLKAV